MRDSIDVAHVRAVAKALCIASALVTVLGAALLWWFFANFELTW